jgi:hypothetical protein
MRWVALIRAQDPAGTHLEINDKGRNEMASSAKRKTTMAKLNRESKLRERRLHKQAKKEARKQAPSDHSELNVAATPEAAQPGPEQAPLAVDRGQP